MYPVFVFGHCFILGGRFHQVLVDEQPHQWIRQVSFSGEAGSPFSENSWWMSSPTSGLQGMKGYRFIRSRLLMRPNSLRFVGSKVAIDGFLFGPLDLLVFFSYIGFATGKSVPQIRKDLKRDFIPAFVLEGARGCSLKAMVDISSPFRGAKRSRRMISCLQDKKSQRVYSGLEILLGMKSLETDADGILFALLGSSLLLGSSVN
ncbi:hypothetical protein D5086_013814 [Populus alba]|uniref:Uncharacterized protein n=1 Tax=Populus alba TaxID=43335 RepID=A0ACC4C7C5_POPAL